MATKRLFIAVTVHPEDELIDRMSEFQDTFSEDRVKWVDPEVMHLTLKFLGDTNEELIPEITEKLKSLQSAHAPFNMTITGTGTFGRPGKPRVIWAGIEGEEPAQALQKGIEDITSEFGFEPEDRDFRPHLTLARVKFLKDTAKLRSMVREDQDRIFQTLPVEAFHLFESELTPQGPKYRILQSFPLEGSD